MAIDKTNLTIDPVGQIYIKISGGKGTADEENSTYPCAEFKFGMAINSIPTARCVVDAGNSITKWSGGETGRVFPEDTLLKIQNHDASSLDTRFYNCTVYEQSRGSTGKDNRITIFKGHVVSAHVNYVTRDGTSRMSIEFACMGKAARLMSCPVSDYTEIDMGNMIDRLTRDAAVDLEAAMASGDSYVRQALNMFAMPWGVTVAKLPIADKVATLVGILKEIGSIKDLKKLDQVLEGDGNALLDKDVKAVFGGKTKLKTSAVGPECEELFCTELYESMTKAFLTGSIYNSIFTSLTSPSFSLILAPRWHCDEKNDFKTEILPVTAWKPRDVIKLDKKDVTSISMDHDSMQAVNTPDVVLVNFGWLASYMLGEHDSGFAGIIGVAAKNESLEKALQSRSLDGKLGKLIDLASTYKIKKFSAPKWLAAITTRDNVIEEGDRNVVKDGLKAEKRPENLEDEKPTKGATCYPTIKRTRSGKGMQGTAFDVADVMAKVLFLHYYMAADTAIVQLRPNLRFGLSGPCLENSLGDTVELDLSGSGNPATKLKIKGVLREVHFAYTSGDYSSVQYYVILERTRLADVKVPEVECPIYKIGPKIK